MEMLLTTQQAAHIANVHPETIRRQARAGTLRSVKIGRALRIPESALHASATTSPSDAIGRAIHAAQEARAALQAATVGPMDAASDLEEVRGGSD